jgi:hypothetical protein
MSGLPAVSAEEYEAKVVKGPRPTVADFWASW